LAELRNYLDWNHTGATLIWGPQNPENVYAPMSLYDMIL